MRQVGLERSRQLDPVDRTPAALVGARPHRDDEAEQAPPIRPIRHDGVFVRGHQPAVAGDVGRQDGGEAPLRLRMQPTHRHCTTVEARRRGVA